MFSILQKKEETVVRGNRIHWVDIAKGILIIMVVYGHIDWIASNTYGSNAFVFKVHTNFLLLPYYMPAFFIITGFCSNFTTPYKKFLKKNFLMLIVPNILIGALLSRWFYLFLFDGLRLTNFLDLNYKTILLTTGGWFLPALFIAKCIFYFLHAKIRNVHYIMVISLVLMLLGIVLYNYKCTYNLWYYQHALIAVPFVVFGFYLKKHAEILDTPYVLISGIILLTVAYFFSYPYLNASPSISLENSILFVVFSVGGSVFVFYIAKKIGKAVVLEYIGKHTLTIYLMHNVCLSYLIRFSVARGLDSMNIYIKIISAIIIVSFSTFIPILIDEIIDRKFPIIKGKIPKRSRK